MNKRILFYPAMLLLFLSALYGQSGDEYQNARDLLSKHKQERYNRASLLQKNTNNHAAGQNQFDARYYKLDLNITFNPNYIYGSVTARFTSLADGLSEITLDFDSEMEVKRVESAGAAFTQSGLELRIQLDRIYNRGEDFTIDISYEGLPSPQRSTYINFGQMTNGNPVLATLSEPYGARFWWPCKDRPSDKADSVDIIITAPDNMLVGSNGTLVSQVNNGNGTKTFHWHEQYPIATYLVSLVVGEYAHFQDAYDYGGTQPMLLDYYVYPDQADLAKELFKEMPDYIDALAYYFGPYPFIEEKYGHAQFGWGGAMEHQTLTSIGRVAEYWRYVYVHELGHQWFGDLVTCGSWSDIWLNEGFASYSEALYAEWAGYGGHPPGIEAYHAYMATQDFRESGTIFISDTTQFSSIFGLIVYDKGSWVLHMLRGMMGDEIFFDVLKKYAHDERWTYGSVRTANFKEICETESALNLNAFFDQWLYQSEYPVYEYSWRIADRSGGKYFLDLEIEQVQQTGLFEMPIQIKFTFENGKDSTITLQNYKYFQNYSFEFEEEPVAINFDPDVWILRSAEEVYREPFTEEVEIVTMGPNPFPNAISNTINIDVMNWVENDIRLEIIDILGRRVKKLIGEPINHYSFHFSWDGTNNSEQRVSSGVYLIKAYNSRNEFINLGKTKKIIFLNN